MNGVPGLAGDQPYGNLARLKVTAIGFERKLSSKN